MAVFDIFSPQVSTVPHGIEGKTILIYGDNGLGKTKQATRLPKPFYLPFERGINAISGIPFLPINTWSDFVKTNKQLTSLTNIDKAKELYQTIVFDTVESAYLMCEEYICNMFEVRRIREGNSGYGLWKEVGAEFWKQINLLTSAGYTVAFIAHESTRTLTNEDGSEYDKIYPKGDKRAVDPICDLVDFIGYVQTNGVDENGKEIPSSIFFKNTKEYKARSRFDYMVESIKEFTAENLQKAIAEAVKKQEEAEGIKSVSYKEQTATYKTEAIPFEELVEKIKSHAMAMHENGDGDKYKEIVEEYLGKGGSVAEAKKSHRQQLELILDDLEKR